MLQIVMVTMTSWSIKCIVSTKRKEMRGYNDLGIHRQLPLKEYQGSIEIVANISHQTESETSVVRQIEIHSRITDI